MAKFTTNFKAEQDNCYIITNGVRMTVKEYNKMRKDKQKAIKVKREKTFIQELPPYINQLVKNNKVLKSLSAFYDNGYRQWGRVARDILNNPMISSHYLAFRIDVREISAEIHRIEEIGKHNEKDIFQIIDKLAMKVEDLRQHMVLLCNGVNESRVCEFYKDKEVINGVGRRLGLQELMFRSLHSINNIDNTIKELHRLADKGLDVFEYSTNGKPRRIYAR